MIEKAMTEVLGHIMQNPKFFYKYHNILTAELFHGVWAEAFYYITDILNEGKAIDTFVMHDKFGDFATELITSYTREIADAVAYLITKKNERIVRDAAERIIHSDTEDAVKIMEDAVYAIKDISNDNRMTNLKAQVDNFYDKVSRIGEGITGLRTDFYKYDIFTSGLQKCELLIIAGETSQGKTSFGLTMMKNIANNEGRVLVLSLEMSTDQLLARLVSQITGINSKRILNRNSSPHELEQIKEALSQIASLNLIVHECHASNISYILDTIRAYKIIRNIDVVFIDYLQLINNQGKMMSREQQVGDVARRLKNVTLELDMPIVCISQLSRNKDNPKPTLSRLRDSGQIEEAADQVIFVYRPETYGIQTFDDGTVTNGKALITIAKGRNVGTTDFRMDFVSHLTLFRDEQEYFEPRNIITPSDDNPF